MKHELSEEERALSNHLIDRYRQAVARRYEYESLKERFELSSQIDKEVIKVLRKYFLECLYPVAKERNKIDNAFDSLNSFISNPAKTWKLLGNMARAIFRFGHHFPQAIKAGVVSLESYLDAKKFEKRLLDSARESGFTPPLTDEQLEQCIAHIPKKEIENFLEHLTSLFRSMANTALLKKTIMIMKDVVRKMEKYPKLYSKQDIEGVELGIHILEQGYDLFKDYPDSLKKEIIVLIHENEKWYLDNIYGDEE